MEIVRRVHSMKEIVAKAKARGLRIGLVPTMGFLHEGHLSLIRGIDDHCDIVVVSIFVNPTQFGPDEDYERYPRDLTHDTEMCIAAGVDYLFTPEVNDIYPPGPRTSVEIAELSERFEGQSRPGHFRGVATVVLKLFNAVQPDIAAFGQKDAQQAVIVQRITRDLLLDVEILVLPIARDDNDIALSSRNKYLTAEQREAARAIPRALEAARQAVAGGKTKAEAILEAARAVIEEQSSLRIDYLELVDKRSLVPVLALDGEALLLVAVFCGETRLLDNDLLAVPSG